MYTCITRKGMTVQCDKHSECVNRCEHKQPHKFGKDFFCCGIELLHCGTEKYGQLIIGNCTEV